MSDNENATTSNKANETTGWRPIGREDYIRNIRVIDYSDSSGAVIARTCRATLVEDLLFLFSTGPDDSECPKVYESCLALAEAYLNGESYETPAEFLRIDLRVEGD